MSAPRAGRSRKRHGVVIAIVALVGVAAVPAVLVQADGSSMPSLLRDGPGVSNHPVNVIPSAGMRIPSHLPLSASGTLTCLTCHERLPAAGTPGEASLRGFVDGMDALEFCAGCHASSDQRSAKSMHWMAMREAHISAEDDRQRSSGSLDSESRGCMECHDGVSAVEFNNSTPWNRGGSYIGDKKRDHPVGVPYPRKTPQGSDSSFRHAAQLPKQMRLPDGKVSCVSCHDLYAAEENLLSVPIQGSALCLTCHDMD